MTEVQAQVSSVTDAQARKTAFIVAAMLLLLAAWNYHRPRPAFAVVLCGLSALLFVSGLFVPPLARRFHTFWMRFATTLGWVNSRILLSLMFYGVFTPFNLIGRVFKRDPLKRRVAQKDSYWTARKQTRQAKEQFERIF